MAGKQSRPKHLRVADEVAGGRSESETLRTEPAGAHMRDGSNAKAQPDDAPVAAGSGAGSDAQAQHDGAPVAAGSGAGSNAKARPDDVPVATNSQGAASGRESAAGAGGPGRVASVAFVVAFFALVLVPLVGMPFVSDDASAEKRELAPAPSLTKDGAPNLNVLSDAGDYFADHFAFRGALVDLDATLKQRLFMTSSTSNVVVGSDGWLYYAGTLNDYQRRNRMSDHELENVATNVALMQEYVTGQGKGFAFAVAPNKNTLYPQNMPYYELAGEGEGNLERLMPLLAARGVRTCDLVTAFQEQDEVLYYERDSHWNGAGALLAYRNIAPLLSTQLTGFEDGGQLADVGADGEEAVAAAGDGGQAEALPGDGQLADVGAGGGQAEAPADGEESEVIAADGGQAEALPGDGQLVAVGTDGGQAAAAGDGGQAEAPAGDGRTLATHVGDVDAMLHPATVEPEDDPHWAAADAWDFANEATSVEDDKVLTVSTAPDAAGTLVMYRDSFGNNLLPYFASAYAQATFTKLVPYDMGVQAIAAADDVVVERTERHLDFFATSPPYLPSPARAIEAEAEPRQGSTSVRLSTNGPYFVVEGSLDEACAGPEDAIYVEVTEADGTRRVVEAFHVSEESAVTADFEGEKDGAAESVIVGDWGYRAYLGMDERGASAFRAVRVLVGSVQQAAQVAHVTVG